MLKFKSNLSVFKTVLSFMAFQFYQKGLNAQIHHSPIIPSYAAISYKTVHALLIRAIVHAKY